VRLRAAKTLLVYKVEFVRLWLAAERGLEHFGLVDGSYSQLSFYTCDKRGSLEDRASQGEQGLLNLLDFVDVLMQLNYGHVLLTRGLLRLDETRRVVYTGNQATRDLWVQGTTVTYRNMRLT
jgi:hypothetical protein